MKTLTFISSALATLHTRYPTPENPTNPSTLPFKPKQVENNFLSHLPSLSISFYCPSRRSTLIIRPIASSAIAFESNSGQHAIKIPRSLQISLSILSAFAPALTINLIFGPAMITSFFTLIFLTTRISGLVSLMPLIRVTLLKFGLKNT